MAINVTFAKALSKSALALVSNWELTYNIDKHINAPTECKYPAATQYILLHSSNFTLLNRFETIFP
jgi:hypothetical protein